MTVHGVGSTSHSSQGFAKPSGGWAHRGVQSGGDSVSRPLYDGWMAVELDFRGSRIDMYARAEAALEEALTADARRPTQFIEPAPDTLTRAMLRQNHLVFGRRGTGKTTLLRKLESDLTAQQHPVAYVDLESLASRALEEIAMEVLRATMLALYSAIPVAQHFAVRDIWSRSRRSSRRSNRRARANLLRCMDRIGRDLAAPRTSSVRVVSANTVRRVAKSTIEGSLDFLRIRGKAQDSDTEETSRRSQREVSSKETKIEAAIAGIPEYRSAIQGGLKAIGHEGFLILDNLHFISRSHQPRLLTVLHQVTKGTGIWLKVATIKHRTTWHGGLSSPGLQLAEDAESIDLDLNLEQFTAVRSFLLNLANTITEEASVGSISVWFQETAVTRAVLGSGGVARDYLTIARRALRHARQRLLLDEGALLDVISDDVDTALRESRGLKEDELVRDSREDEAQVRNWLVAVRDFCLLTTRRNCILVSKDAPPFIRSRTAELADMRFLHIVHDNVHVPGRNNSFSAYMLDVGEYIGRSSIRWVTFWSEETGGHLALQDPVLVFDPPFAIPGISEEAARLLAATEMRERVFVSVQPADPLSVWSAQRVFAAFVQLRTEDGMPFRVSVRSDDLVILTPGGHPEVVELADLEQCLELARQGHEPSETVGVSRYLLPMVRHLRDQGGTGRTTG